MGNLAGQIGFYSRSQRLRPAASGHGQALVNLAVPRGEGYRRMPGLSPARRAGVEIRLDHGVDNLAMAMSLVASARGLALMPAYAKNLLPESVVSRPLEVEAPTIDVAVGYSKSIPSPIIKLFLSRLDELVAPDPA